MRDGEEAERRGGGGEKGRRRRDREAERRGGGGGETGRLSDGKHEISARPQNIHVKEISLLAR